MTTNECIKYDQLVELGIATAEEINLVRNIMNGSWEEIFNAICYARTGYRTLEQLYAEEFEEEEEDW